MVVFAVVVPPGLRILPAVPGIPGSVCRAADILLSVVEPGAVVQVMQ